MKNNYFFIKQFSNIYKKTSKNSEVISQILYGEKFCILLKNKGWLKIKTSFDYYIGYIENKNYVKSLNLLNSIDKEGTREGLDIDVYRDIRDALTIDDSGTHFLVPELTNGTQTITLPAVFKRLSFSS